MSSKNKIKYQFTSAKAVRLSLQHRILLFMFRRDIARGRDGQATDSYGDLKEAIFMFSSTFIHFADVIFCSVIYWDELDEYHITQPQEDRPPLPKGYVALARATTARRGAFNRQLTKLVSDGSIYAFQHHFRALEGLGRQTAPLLQIWDAANRDKPKDILAVSLRDAGFQKAATIDKQHTQICLWELHEAIIADRNFARELTRR